MRCLAFAILLLVYSANVAAQEQTLANEDGEGGGFGALVLKFTSIKNKGALIIGGRGGWIIDHSLVLGGGAYALQSEVDAPEGALPLEGPLDIEFGYLGFEIEYIVKPQSPLHYSLYAFIGGGATNYAKDVGPFFKSTEQAGETKFMFVLEPAANAELNIKTWFRLNAGISYRLVLGVTQPGLKNSDFTGLNATLTFKFGTF